MNLILYPLIKVFIRWIFQSQPNEQDCCIVVGVELRSTLNKWYVGDTYYVLCLRKYGRLLWAYHSSSFDRCILTVYTCSDAENWMTCWSHFGELESFIEDWSVQLAEVGDQLSSLSMPKSHSLIYITLLRHSHKQHLAAVKDSTRVNRCELEYLFWLNRFLTWGVGQASL